MNPGFQAGVPEISRKKNSNMHPYSINKLSTKKNTQKSLFLNILKYNHLPKKNKRHETLLFLNTIIYEKGTRRSFKSSKLSTIESKLNVETISFSMYNNIKESVEFHHVD